MLCAKRKAKRTCPGVRGGICSICCGEQREETVACPLDCEYLIESRKREKPQPMPATIPNADIQVTEKFLREQAELLNFTAQSLLAAAFEIPGVVDSDIREALTALTRTYRTRESGLIYDTRPDNLLAGALQERVELTVREFRERKQQTSGMFSVRDADVLGVLVFLQRLELQFANGRRRGRAFIDYLRGYFESLAEATPAAP
jgi:hypothetical protein